MVEDGEFVSLPPADSRLTEQEKAANRRRWWGLTDSPADVQRYNGGLTPERLRIVPKPGGGYQVERVRIAVDVLEDFESYDLAAQWIRERIA